MGWRARRAMPPLVVDGALALALTAATQVELSLAEVVEGPVWAQRLAFLVMTAAVAGRRVAPLAAALLCGAGLAAQTPLGTATVVGGFLASMIVTHAVALRCERGPALVGLAGVLVGVHLYDVLFWAESSVADLVGNAAIYLAIWGLGRGARHWRSQAAELRRRVEEAAREQEERAAEAVRAERARVARELHDVVAHGISMMTLQAGAARRVLDGKPASAHGALLAVEDHGRRSLEDMHRLRGVLRRGTGASAVAVDGGPGPVADGGDVEDLDGDGEDVGSVGGSVGAGLGLLGMAERASALGGELHAGPSEHGWRVLARLPRSEGSGDAAPPRDAAVSGRS